jgi:hypothetical protein
MVPHLRCCTNIALVLEAEFLLVSVAKLHEVQVIDSLDNQYSNQQDEVSEPIVRP